MNTIDRKDLLAKLDKLAGLLIDQACRITLEATYGLTCQEDKVDNYKSKRLLLWKFYIDGLVLPRPFIDDITKIDFSPAQAQSLVIALKKDGA